MYTFMHIRVSLHVTYYPGTKYMICATDNSTPFYLLPVRMNQLKIFNARSIPTDARQEVSEEKQTPRTGFVCAAIEVTCANFFAVTTRISLSPPAAKYVALASNMTECTAPPSDMSNSLDILSLRKSHKRTKPSALPEAR